MSDATSNPAPPPVRFLSLAVRGLLGGFLMGLANLVPGISGGTMLLAAGIYPPFINAVAEVTTFRFRAGPLCLLGAVVLGGLVAIAAFAGVVSMLVVEHRWIMYSVFIGLTLGGVPVIWKLVRPVDSVVVLATIVGIIAMALLALADPGSAQSAGGDDQRAYAILVLAGVAGGSAMILPGVSGGYLLLVLGQYLVILTAIDAAADAVRGRDWATAFEQTHVFLPVGVGVVIGVVGVSNLIKILLARFEKATLGVLMGFLLGAVFGLWPFQRALPPEIGQAIKGVILATPEMVAAVKPKDWPTETFTPTAGHLAGSLGLIVVGFLISTGIAWIGEGSDAPQRRRGHRGGERTAKAPPANS